MTSNTNSRKRGSDQSDKVSDPKKLRRAMADRPSHRDNTITVLVGKYSQSFTVDRNTLLASSKLFKDTLNTSPDTSRPEQVQLPRMAPRAFQIYLGWLDTGYFYIMEEDDLGSPPQSDKHGHHLDGECDKWDECYILGHTIQDYDFQDACIDWAHEKMVSDKATMTDIFGAVYWSYDQLPAHRQFAVDTAAHLWTEDEFNILKEEDYSRAFMIDLLKHVGPKMRRRALAMEDQEDFFRDTGCKYHAHVALNKPCYKKTHPAYK